MKRSPLLISFEGMDGAGKTTAAAAVTRELNDRGVNAKFLNKKTRFEFHEESVTKHMHALQDILWLKQNTDHVTLFSGRHWCLLIASWFQAYDLIIPRLDCEVVIVDGLHFKYLARYLRRDDFEGRSIRDMFSASPTPDISILLKLDSAEAFRRKKDFSPFEAGQQDGVTGSLKEAFCSYQEGVFEELSRELRDKSTEVIELDAGGPEEAIAMKATEIVMARLSCGEYA